MPILFTGACSHSGPFCHPAMAFRLGKRCSVLFCAVLVVPMSCLCPLVLFFVPLSWLVLSTFRILFLLGCVRRVALLVQTVRTGCRETCVRFCCASLLCFQWRDDLEYADSISK